MDPSASCGFGLFGASGPRAAAAIWTLFVTAEPGWKQYPGSRRSGAAGRAVATGRVSKVVTDPRTKPPLTHRWIG